MAFPSSPFLLLLFSLSLSQSLFLVSHWFSVEGWNEGAVLSMNEWEHFALIALVILLEITRQSPARFGLHFDWSTWF